MSLGCGEQVNDVLDGPIGFVVSGFQFAEWPVCGIGLVVEAAVGQRTTEALVEEPEQERDLDPFGREPVGVAGAMAFEEAVSFQLAEIVAELVQPVGLRRELKRGEDGLVDLSGGPAADGVAGMEENLQ